MMRLLAPVAVALLLLAGCSGSTSTSSTGSTNEAKACEQYNDVKDPRGLTEQDKVKVLFRTTLGDFTVETNATLTPKTVANFLQYVDDGFYACTTVHRVAPDFVIQGGGYLDDHSTHKTTRAPIPLEATPAKPNKQWTLSMARTNVPDSATSEFFVNLVDNRGLDATRSGTGYAVFAKVVSGFDTIEAMTAVTPGQSFPAGGFYPATPIVILQAVRV